MSYTLTEYGKTLVRQALGGLSYLDWVYIHEIPKDHRVTLENIWTVPECAPLDVYRVHLFWYGGGSWDAWRVERVLGET